MDTTQLPCLSNKISGLNAEIKKFPQDFQVTEVPLYPLSGEGEHLYLEIEKTGVATFAVIRSLAEQLAVARERIGYAGLKDTHAVTRQWLSLQGITEEKLASLALPAGVKIVTCNRHTNKLKIGHLQANQFQILLRGAQAHYHDEVREVLERLTQVGVANYFTQQRFGKQQNNDLVGKAILHNQPEEIVRLLVGKRHSDDTPLLKEAKELVAQEQYEEAYQLLPRSLEAEKAVIKALKKGKQHQVSHFLPKRLRNFYLSAYQSRLFNHSLAGRIAEIDQVWWGDLAVKHPGRAVFLVEEIEKEQPRAARLEISPSGPIFGSKMTWPQGKQGQREYELFQQEELSDEKLKRRKLRGERRSYRFILQNPTTEVCAEGIWVGFTLPKGCYATAVIREILQP